MYSYALTYVCKSLLKQINTSFLDISCWIKFFLYYYYYFIFGMKLNFTFIIWQCFPVEVPQLINTTLQVISVCTSFLVICHVNRLNFFFIFLLLTDQRNWCLSFYFCFFLYYQKLVVLCLTREDDHDPSKTTTKTALAAIFARILVMNTNYLAQLTSEPILVGRLRNAGSAVEENILLCLVDVWLDKVTVTIYIFLSFFILW